jgi:formate-dependent nitrite reductase cytochrome c552 subunit
MFAGTGGFGVKDMPSPHNKAMPKKCVTCHMYKAEKKTDEEEKAEEADPRLRKGGHTFRADDRVCLKCHEDPKSIMAKWREQISPLLEELKSLLDSTPDKASKAYRSARQNYNMVMADRGMGMHNPKYAVALLRYGISALRVESVWK